MIFVRSDSPGIFPLKEQTHAAVSVGRDGAVKLYEKSPVALQLSRNSSRTNNRLSNIGGKDANGFESNFTNGLYVNSAIV